MPEEAGGAASPRAQRRDALPSLRTLALTTATMLAFAANSLLCRAALQRAGIDPASFASLRLASGALMLFILVRLTRGTRAAVRPDWLAATMLFAYVAFFSFAYVSLTAGTGALILFGAVQLTMFSAGLRAGERFRPGAWAGFVLAALGLLYLVSPGIAAPPPLGAALMGAAGIAWGVYSLRGRGAGDPLVATAANFLRATPIAVALSLAWTGQFRADGAGIGLAITSGALTSGLGYVIWYAALKGLTAMRAATVQLSVPPIAAFGGALLLGEAVTARLLFASTAILGGIALVLASRARPR